MKKLTIVAVIALGWLGCEADSEPLPAIEFYLSDAWTEPEAEAILQGIEEWEEKSCLDLFEFRGFVPHDGGWTEEEWYDNILVVYPFSQIDTTPDIERYLEEEGGFRGYFVGDVLLYRWVRLQKVGDQICFYDRDGNQISCSRYTDAARDPLMVEYLNDLKTIASHEFGHVLGLRHNTSQPSVMGGDGAPADYWMPEPTKADIDNLCQLRPCPARCPTRP